ncbi:MAG: response regulator transcription factor [Saprospiraceae bacterium]|nr:response regulator transcription factor [Saprospiraceae bacterium]
MNILIVDDEPLAQDVLETHINNIPELKIVAKCNNAIEAHKVLNEHHIDLMFLDIQMPQLTGLEFIKMLKNPPLIVLTTAYPNYAVEGYEFDVLDYLLKPIAFDRLFKAVNKAKERLQLTSKSDQLISQKTEQAVEQEYMFVKSDKKLIKIKYDDIIYIEGLKDYVIIRQDTGRIITLQTMKSLEEKLPQEKFVRIHRSYITNLERINAIEGNMLEIMEKGQLKHLPIGKNYRDELLELINKNKI